jgi:hypothetical protein
MFVAFPFRKAVLAAAAVVAVSLNVPGKAATYSGELPAGYSDSVFQIGSDTTRLSINVNALGTRDPSICSTCYSSYTDNFTVNFYDSTGEILKSYSEINYLYYNMYTSSHGIGAGPVFVGAPTGATTMEIVSQLTIAGLLGTDGLPLGLGNLNIVSDGSMIATTPIPSSVTLMTSMLGLAGVFAWYRRKKGSAALIAPA